VARSAYPLGAIAMAQGAPPSESRASISVERASHYSVVAMADDDHVCRRARREPLQRARPSDPGC
jgi:hypothetical protein